MSTDISAQAIPVLIQSGRIFLIFFVNSLGQQTGNNLNVIVTGQFSQSYLLPVVSLVSNLVSGIIKLPVAKLMDIWGRPQGYVAMLFCAVIGTALPQYYLGHVLTIE